MSASLMIFQLDKEKLNQLGLARPISLQRPKVGTIARSCFRCTGCSLLCNMRQKRQQHQHQQPLHQPATGIVFLSFGRCCNQNQAEPLPVPFSDIGQQSENPNCSAKGAPELLWSVWFSCRRSLGAERFSQASLGWSAEAKVHLRPQLISGRG